MFPKLMLAGSFAGFLTFCGIFDGFQWKSVLGGVWCAFLQKFAICTGIEEFDEIFMYTYGFAAADGCLSMSKHYLHLSGAILAWLQSGVSPVSVRSRLAHASLSRSMAHSLYVFLAEGRKDNVLALAVWRHCAPVQVNICSLICLVVKCVASLNNLVVSICSQVPLTPLNCVVVKGVTPLNNLVVSI